MEKVYARTKGIRDDMVSGFCPGCMHSTVIKLIGEVLEEMHLLDKAACAVGVGCCGLHMDYITYDYFLAAHGRACAVATGAKRSNPESLRFISAQSASALGDEFRYASRLVWPLASLRHSATRKVFFCGVHAAAKNGLDLFRGLRAANSVRLKKLPRP